MMSRMLRCIYKFLEKLAPEGIPFPGSRSYSMLARSRLMRDFYRQVADEVADELSRGKILDVGTGPGYLPIELARLAPNAVIVGIDISRDMIKIARRNAEGSGVSNVKFMVEDANKMSFEDSSFDLIVSTGSLHHWRKPLRVINELYRVLKDEGQAWIYDLRRDVPEDIIVNKLRGYGYGRLRSVILYNAVKVHSSIELQDVLNMLRDRGNRFKRYEVEGIWHSYPILKIKLLKDGM